ncbi:hypothetical protein Peur_063434 [Populus x canadensis]
MRAVKLTSNMFFSYLSWLMDMAKLFDSRGPKTTKVTNPLKVLLLCITVHRLKKNPVDFTSDMGRRSVIHPSVLKMSHPPRILSWMANGFGSGLDALFLYRLNHGLLSIGGLCAPLL